MRCVINAGGANGNYRNISNLSRIMEWWKYAADATIQAIEDAADTTVEVAEDAVDAVKEVAE